MRDSILIELERAELVARERRLAAAGEADRRLAAARGEADRIAAGLDDAVEQALDARRREHAQRAAAEIATVEAALRALEASDGAGSRSTSDLDPRADEAERAAADLVVAVVLGEQEA